MSTTTSQEESYKLTIVPNSYYELQGAPLIPECIECKEALESLDRFDETILNGVRSGFYYVGDFMMCPNCGHAHYIVDHTNHLLGPATLSWPVK